MAPVTVGPQTVGPQTAGSQVAGRVNAMTVDVEDYYQVSAFEGAVTRQQWGQMESRVEANVDRILQLFSDAGVNGTFFMLGCLAERYPEMVRRIVAEGHELASHGWQHVRVTRQSREAFGADVRKTRALLQQLSGEPVLGYRAASYSINGDNLWAHEELAAAGHRYSSSVAPVDHDLYGMPESPRFPYRTADGRLLEIPVTTIRLAGRNLNCAGGGWFRLYPYWFSRWALGSVNDREGQAAIFYFHPWEIDPAQPRPAGVTARSRFRHYLNLSRMEPRLVRLLADFRWDRVDRVYGIAEGVA